MFIDIWSRWERRLPATKNADWFITQRRHDRRVRVDYHGSKEVPTGTCHAVLKAAAIGESAHDRFEILVGCRGYR
jgi:hypothetical protein